MNPKQWSRVRALFLEVCDLAPDERDRVLRESCHDDETLRAEVTALIASANEASALFDSLPVTPNPEDPQAFSGEPLAGRRLGAYRVVKTIASGGMGTVYLAERADEQYRKTVAVKLIRRGMLDETSLVRFRRERQALALLDHPNIARLLDGGVTDEGLPFLVMEYVEGTSICSYCDQHRLSVTARLRLFRKVCSAVQYAHRNLVVHRDLKPGNILVTPDGTPKLLDFGIAKMLQPEGDLAPADETAVHQRPMTPEYASPEQVRGEPVTTASDVYSLGVILYRLLTGHRPYRTKSARASELERTILETDPVPPSSVIWQVEPSSATHRPATVTPLSVSEVREGTPHRLSRRLRGDLDNIVLMALRKEPLRRYATAEQFGEDIDRFLANRPVTARKDTIAYRTAKFVRRNTVGVVAAALVAISLLVGAIGIAGQARVAERQRDEAITARAEAEAIVAFLESMLTSLNPGAEGRDVSVREVLDRAAARIERDLEVDPKVKASLVRTIGLSYASLGMYELAEPHLRAALELRRSELGETHPEVIESLNDLGNHLFATAELEEAEGILRAALAANTARFGPDHDTTLAIKINLAEVLGEHRDIDQAERLLREVLAVRRARHGVADLDVAATLDRLSGVVVRRSDWEEAGRLLEEALDIHRQSLKPGHPLVIESTTNLARVRQAQGRDEEARQLLGQIVPPLRRALMMHRSALGNQHIMTLVLMNDLAELLQARGELEDAESLFREALGSLEQRVEEGDPSARHRNNRALVQYNLASLLLDRGALDEAESLLHQAFVAQQESLGPNHLEVATTLSALARLAERRGNLDEAVRLADQALQIRRQRLNPKHPLVIESQARIGELQAARDRETRALHEPGV